jgi:hypothetical protein
MQQMTEPVLTPSHPEESIGVSTFSSDQASFGKNCLQLCSMAKNNRVHASFWVLLETENRNRISGELAFEDVPSELHHGFFRRYVPLLLKAVDSVKRMA